MTIAPLLIKMHEDEALTKAELELVHKTIAQHNVSIHEALALYIWSSCSTPLQEQLKCGNTYNYVTHVSNQLASQLWCLASDGEEVRCVLEALQNVCYADKTIAELYAFGKQIAPNKHMQTPILSAMRNIHIAVNANTIIAKLRTAIQKNSNSTPLTVYRAMKEPVEGNEIITRGLMSTSLTEEASFAKYDEYKTVLKIHVPPGVQCVDVAPFSVYDVVESEVLFPPNVIRITEREVKADKVYLTGILEILDDFPKPLDKYT